MFAKATLTQMRQLLSQKAGHLVVGNVYDMTDFEIVHALALIGMVNLKNR